MNFRIDRASSSLSLYQPGFPLSGPIGPSQIFLKSSSIEKIRYSCSIGPIDTLSISTFDSISLDIVYLFSLGLVMLLCLNDWLGEICPSDLGEWPELSMGLESALENGVAGVYGF